jgi:hypothetical protein
VGRSAGEELRQKRIGVGRNGSAGRRKAYRRSPGGYDRSGVFNGSDFFKLRSLGFSPSDDRPSISRLVYAEYQHVAAFSTARQKTCLRDCQLPPARRNAQRNGHREPG